MKSMKRTMKRTPRLDVPVSQSNLLMPSAPSNLRVAWEALAVQQMPIGKHLGLFINTSEMATFLGVSPLWFQWLLDGEADPSIRCQAYKGRSERLLQGLPRYQNQAVLAITFVEPRGVLA